MTTAETTELSTWWRKASEITPEQAAADLTEAGWSKVRGKIWKSPAGGFHLGPFGAWIAMKQAAK